MSERLTDAELAEFVALGDRTKTTPRGQAFRDLAHEVTADRNLNRGFAAARELQDARRTLYRVLEVPRYHEAGEAIDAVLEFFEKYPVKP